MARSCARALRPQWLPPQLSLRETLLMLPQQLADRLARFETVGDCRRLGSRTEQRLHNGYVVSCVPMPAVFGAVERASQRSNAMRAVQLELGLISKNLPNHLRVAVPRRPLQRRHVELAPCVHGPACRHHEPYGAGVVVLRGIGQPATLSVRQCLDEIRSAGQQGAEDVLVPQLACLRYFHILWTLIHEESKHFLMAEVAGDLMRRSVPPKKLEVDRTAASGIVFRKIRLG